MTSKNLPLITVVISCDFRYVHWNVTAALVSAVFLIFSIQKKTPEV